MREFMAPLRFASLLLLLSINFSSCKIIYEGKYNTTAFTVIDSKTIELFNPHRSQGAIKFTFESGNITKVQHDNGRSWNLLMNDDSKNHVRVSQTNHADSNTTIFDFLWWHDRMNISDPQVCFEVGGNNATWFSTYLESGQPWPYNTGKPIPKPLPFMTGSYGPNQFGPVIEELFFTTDGFALHLTSYNPAYLSRPTERQLCFTVHSEYFQPADKTHYISLSFNLIAGENIQKVHEAIVNKFKIENKPYKGAIPDERIFNQTSLTLDTKGLNQSQILENAQELAKQGLKNLQLVLENWEAHYGDLTFDQTRFSDPKSLISQLHTFGYLIKLTVCSFVSNQSETFKLQQEILLKKSPKIKEVLTFTWGSHGNGTLFDLTGGYRTSHWIVEKLKNLQNKTNVDSFRFIGGELGTYGIRSLLPERIMHLEHYGNMFTTDFEAVGKQLGKLVEMDSAYSGQSWPLFIRPQNIEPSWTALKSVIPTALTMNLANYNFQMAPSFKAAPSEELYIRWLQVVTFFPAVQIPFAHWKIGNKAANLTHTFLDLHLEHSQMITTEAKNSTVKGRPLLRPLWYLAPEDSRTYAIGDQFALGNDLIVAPVLTAGTNQRTVYLPAGKWIDAHGKSYTGPGSFTVQAPLEELPYLKRQHL